MLSNKDFKRFLNKIDTSPGHGPHGDCWIWRNIKENSYGSFWLNGRMLRAMHLVLDMEGQPRPEGLICLHSCDNRRCVNPAHLRWGTYQDNSDDAVSRSRYPKGRKPANALYDDNILSAVRTSSEGAGVLSLRLGVSKDVIYTAWEKCGIRPKRGVLPTVDRELFEFVRAASCGAPLTMTLRDIAARMGKHHPQLSVAMRRLIAAGHITIVGKVSRVTQFAALGDGPPIPTRVAQV